MSKVSIAFTAVELNHNIVVKSGLMQCGGINTERFLEKIFHYLLGEELSIEVKISNLDISEKLSFGVGFCTEKYERGTFTFTSYSYEFG